MPSGVPVGSRLSLDYEKLMAERDPVPAHRIGLIEDGTYTEIKDCIFRALAYWIMDVAIDDMLIDIIKTGISAHIEHKRQWMFGSPHEMSRNPITELVVSMQVSSNCSPPDISRLVRDLQERYGFLLDSYSTDRRSCHIDAQRGYVYLDGSQSIQLNIRWPYWI